VRPREVHLDGLGGKHTGLHPYTGSLQGRRATGGHRVRVDLPEHHTGDAGAHQRIDARTRPPGVAARLERDVGRPSPGGRTGSPQRFDLGVRAAGSAVVSLPDHRASGIGDHRANQWIDVRWGSSAGQFEGTPQVVLVAGLGGVHCSAVLRVGMVGLGEVPLRCDVAVGGDAAAVGQHPGQVEHVPGS